MANTYKNAAVVLSTTAATDLYTTPTNTRSIVQSINVANVDTSNRNVTVTWYDASAGASFTLLYNALIPAGTAMNALDTPLVLEAGDIVRVQASASNTLHATASVLQIDNTSAIVDSSVTSTKLADASVTSTKLASNLKATIICTSSTRPASPFEGQRIYQTDDKRELIYNGSAWVTLTPVSATNNNQGSTISTSYTSTLTGLAGSSPSVTLQTGTSVLVSVGTYTWTGTTNAWSAASPAVSGATTLAASDDRSAGFETTSPGYGTNPSRTFAITSLTPGVNTFTVQYRVSAGTGQFLRTNLTVQGLP